MDGRLIGRIDFEMKILDSSPAAKINVELHQFLADAQLSVIRVDTNPEKLGFLCHISETDKTDHRMTGSILFLRHETMGERMLHLLEKHLLRPRHQGVRSLYGENLFQVFRDHLPDVPVSAYLTTIHHAPTLRLLNAIPFDS
jgi:hypothetical protein